MDERLRHFERLLSSHRDAPSKHQLARTYSRLGRHLEAYRLYWELGLVQSEDPDASNSGREVSLQQKPIIDTLPTMVRGSPDLSAEHWRFRQYCPNADKVIAQGKPVLAIHLQAFRATEVLDHLLRWPHWVALKLVCENSKEPWIQPLRKFHFLEKLSLRKCSVDRHQIESLTSLQNLQALDLRVSGDDAMRSLRSLQKLPKLSDLSLQGSWLSGLGMESLQGLRGLKTLNLGATGIQDSDLQCLKGLKTLEDLTLTRTNIDGGGLKALAKLPKLEKLELGRSCVRELATFKRGWKNLQYLNLQWNNFFHRRELRHLTKLHKLRVLDLTACDIGGDELVALRALNDLEVLSIDRIRLDRSGLEILQTCQSLKILSVREVEWPPGGREELLEALPNTLIREAAQSNT